MKSKIVIDADRFLAKKYVHGGLYVKAIRFANGMTEEDIRKSLEKRPPLARDWMPYCESRQVFCGDC